jgi:DNA-binding MarR family transcriptional regulator
MFHTAIAERAGLTATDAKTMGILARHGSLTAGELASHTGLATASVTSLIDRLETKGMVRRIHDRADRRRVIVEPVRENTEGNTSFFGAIQSAIEALVEDYSDGQLQTILEFMRRTTERIHAITVELSATGAGHAVPPNQQKKRRKPGRDNASGRAHLQHFRNCCGDDHLAMRACSSMHRIGSLYAFSSLFVHRGCAAFFAASVRCSGVMAAGRRLGPIRPPRRPMAAMTRDMTELVTFEAEIGA